MRGARATARTGLVLLLALLTAMLLGRPAFAGDEPAGDTDPPVADGTPVTNEDFGTITQDQPHLGGYTPTPTRYTAKPSTVGGGAYDQVPASVDLSPYLPEVGDQGAVGQCVAWTITRNLMGYYAKRASGVDAPYAPLFLYMRNVASGGAPNSGLNPETALASAQSAGVDAQDDYFQGTSNYKVAPTSTEIASAANYKINSWTRLFSGSNQGVNAKTVLQQALANGNPVAVGFPVYADFMNLGAHTLYTTTSGTSLGGHMVTAYGYDADGVYLRNQWGTSWGNSGSAHVSWAFVETVMAGAYIIGGITTPAASITPVPQVTALSTSKGAAGATITLTGSGLARATAVTFGTTTASFTANTVNGVTRMAVTVPAHVPGTVSVVVTNPAGTSPDTSADDFTYPAGAPAITAVSPSTGSTAGGTTVTVTGTDLTGATVKVGTTSVTPSNVTATSLTFVTPAHAAGSAAVTVTTSGGTSASKAYTYVTPPAPAIDSLSPAAALGTATTQVTITGSNLADASGVTVDGPSVAFTVLSDTQLRASFPAHAAGPVTVRVSGASGDSGTLTFTYTAYGVPTISSLSPSSGATTVTTTVVVTGTDLSNVTTVVLGGTTLSWTMVSETQLKVFVAPRAAGRASLTVTTRGGTSNAVTFTTVAPARPVIAALSPAQGLTTATTAVTISGSGLTGATRVSLGGKAMTFTRVSDTRLTFNAPAHAAAALPVIVVGPGGTSAAKTFTYKSTLVPQLLAMSPNTGSTLGSTVTVLSGRYLTGASAVYAGTARVSFTRISDSQIRITLVRHAAGPVPIKVVTAGGTSNAVTFTYALPPAPVITGLSSTSAAAGSTVVITLTGTNLAGTTRVTLGGLGVRFTQVSATQLTVTLPGQAAATYDLVVTTPAGSSAKTAATKFRFT